MATDSTEFPPASAVKTRGPGRPRKTREGTVFAAKEKKARARMDGYKGDLEKLLFRQVRAFEWAQEALIRQMTRGAAAGQTFLTKDDCAQLVSLGGALEKIIEAQGKYLKDQKALGGRLTEAQLLEAAIKRIMDMEDTPKRRDVLRRMVDAHHAGHRPQDLRLRAPSVQALALDSTRQATDAIADLLRADA